MIWKGWDGPSSTSMVEMPAVTVRAHRPSQMLSAVRTVVKGHRRATTAIAVAAVCVALLTWHGPAGQPAGGARRRWLTRWRPCCGRR